MNTLVKTIANDNVFPTLFSSIFNDTDFAKNTRAALVVPPSNVSENDKSFSLEIAAPGLKKEDFKINLHENKLTISVEKREEGEETNKNFHRKEFSYEAFSRSFRLPNSVEAKKIEATYEEGILHISLPKKEEAEPKFITVG